jgi:hypothetical protein
VLDIVSKSLGMGRLGGFSNYYSHREVIQMKRLVLIALSFAATLAVCGFASAGSVSTDFGRVVILVVVEGDNVMRLGVDPTPPQNPAGCNTTDAGFALQLDAPGRSAEETRMLVNSAQLAFMTARRVSLRIRDDLCLTLEGFPHRVVTGITVLY